MKYRTVPVPQEFTLGQVLLLLPYCTSSWQVGSQWWVIWLIFPLGCFTDYCLTCSVHREAMANYLLQSDHPPFEHIALWETIAKQMSTFYFENWTSRSHSPTHNTSLTMYVEVWLPSSFHWSSFQPGLPPSHQASLSLHNSDTTNINVHITVPLLSWRPIEIKLSFESLPAWSILP